MWNLPSYTASQSSLYNHNHLDMFKSGQMQPQQPVSSHLNASLWCGGEFRFATHNCISLFSVFIFDDEYQHLIDLMVPV